MCNTGLTDTHDSRNFTSIKNKRKQTFCIILVDIIVQLKLKFDHFSGLSFLGLANVQAFPKWQESLMTPNCRACQKKRLVSLTV